MCSGCTSSQSVKGGGGLVFVGVSVSAVRKQTGQPAHCGIGGFSISVLSLCDLGHVLVYHIRQAYVALYGCQHKCFCVLRLCCRQKPAADGQHNLASTILCGKQTLQESSDCRLVVCFVGAPGAFAEHNKRVAGISVVLVLGPDAVPKRSFSKSSAVLFNTSIQQEDSFPVLSDAHSSQCQCQPLLLARGLAAGLHLLKIDNMALLSNVLKL